VSIACTPSTFSLGEQGVSCRASDTNGNESDPASLTVTTSWAYIVEIDRIRGNKSAGSTIPLDFRYRDPATGEVIDSSSFSPVVIWVGPFSKSNCGGVNLDTDSGMDAGNSSYRLTGNTWQFSWQTPSTPGSYLVSVDPPGTGEPFLCVALK
jgi:hypothetical protein